MFTRNIKYSHVIAGALVSGILVGATQVVATARDGQLGPEFPTNANGLTYGSAADAKSPDEEPDLILVIGNKGNLGYIYKSDQEPQMPASPEEAVAQSRIASTSRTIPVFYSDGKTQIDTFTMSPADEVSLIVGD